MSTKMLSKVSKVLLKNTIRHTDSHNKLLEESDMWKQHEKQRDTATHSRKGGSTGRDLSNAYMDISESFSHCTYLGREAADANSSTYWMRKLQKTEDKDPGRWGHSGFKEQNPDLFDEHRSSRDSDSESERERKPRKIHKERKKSKKKKYKKERKHRTESPHKRRKRRYSHSSESSDEDGKTLTWVESSIDTKPNTENPHSKTDKQRQDKNTSDPTEYKESSHKKRTSSSSSVGTSKTSRHSHKDRRKKEKDDKNYAKNKVCPYHHSKRDCPNRKQRDRYSRSRSRSRGDRYSRSRSRSRGRDEKYRRNGYKRKKRRHSSSSRSSDSSDSDGRYRKHR